MNPRNGTHSGGNGGSVRERRERAEEPGRGPGSRGELSMREGPFGRARERENYGPRPRGEEPRVRVRARRWRGGGMTARDVMTRSPRTARPSDSVQQISQIMIDEDCGIVPITDQDGRLLGVVTDRDIVCRLVARGIDMKEARARDVMTDEVECVTEHEDLHSVLRLMSEHQVRRIPVVARGDRLMGIISMADLAREADVDADLQETFDEISSARRFWSRMR